MARAYPVHEVKAKLSELLRRVKRGRSVTISEHGREIARIVPVERSSDLPARIAGLERDGIVLRRASKPARIKPAARRPGALKRFLRSRE